MRTPDERFRQLPDYPFSPHYTEVDGLRIHHVEEGAATSEPVLLLHGEPSWSFLYRHMISVLAAAGHRAVAPDLIGFGRSDKPVALSDYTYQRHVDWMAQWMRTNDLRNITLVCQDWGSLIGLRLAAEEPDRFARIVLANGGLLTGEIRMPPAFQIWKFFATWTPRFPVGRIVSWGCRTKLAPEVIAAYDAPFPHESYKAGARAFPRLVPTTPDNPAAPACRRAWEALQRWNKPFLTAFSDGDPITRGGHRMFQKGVPGAHGQPHVTIRGAGHFLQEDKGIELARVVVDFIARTR